MSESSSTLTKQHLIKSIASSGLPYRLAGQVVEYTFSQLVKALKRGEVIHLVGFGAFHFKQRKSRKARNPKTGETVFVNSKRVIHFKPSTWLKQSVRLEPMA